MKTFGQCLTSLKRDNLIKEAFVLLEQKNISSNLFVEWYSNEGFLLNEKDSINWVRKRIRITENTEILQSHIDAASKALNNLHARLNRSSILKQAANSSEFSQLVLNLISVLQDPNQLVEPQEQPQEEPAQASTQAEGYTKFVQKMKLKIELKELEKNGVNTCKLFEWYLMDGQTLNEGPYFDRFKDFVGNTWANVKGAWNRGFSGWGAEGQERQKTVDKQRDQAALTNTDQSLDNLVDQISQMGMQPKNDFMDMVQQIKQEIQHSMAELQKQQDQPQPQQPAQTQQPQQQPAPAPQPSYNVGGVQF